MCLILGPIVKQFEEEILAPFKKEFPEKEIDFYLNDEWGQAFCAVRERITGKWGGYYNEMATFKLSGVPDLDCYMVWSSGSFVHPSYRGKGLGKFLLGMREKICSAAGLSQMLARVRTDNKVEQHLLESAGWKCLSELDIVFGKGKKEEGYLYMKELK